MYRAVDGGGGRHPGARADGGDGERRGHDRRFDCGRQRIAGSETRCEHAVEGIAGAGRVDDVGHRVRWDAAQLAPWESNRAPLAAERDDDWDTRALAEGVQIG